MLESIPLRGRLSGWTLRIWSDGTCDAVSAYTSTPTFDSFAELTRWIGV